MTWPWENNNINAELQEKLDNWESIPDDEVVLKIRYKYRHFLCMFVKLAFSLLLATILFIILMPSSEREFFLIAWSICFSLFFLIYRIPYTFYPKFYFYEDRVHIKQFLHSTVIYTYEDLGLYFYDKTPRLPQLYAPHKYHYVFRVLPSKTYLYHNQKKEFTIKCVRLFRGQINDLLALMGYLSGDYYNIDTFKDNMKIEPLLKKA